MSYISPEVRLEALTVTVAVGLASPCVQDSVSVEGETFSVGLAVGSVMVPEMLTCTREAPPPEMATYPL